MTGRRGFLKQLCVAVAALFGYHEPPVVRGRVVNYLVPTFSQVPASRFIDLIVEAGEFVPLGSMVHIGPDNRAYVCKVNERIDGLATRYMSESATVGVRPV